MALLPAALVAILTLWCGTFQGVASAPGALSHQIAVLAFCLLAPNLGDPLDLGLGGRVLLLAALALVIISWSFSPVSRAGQMATLLLPAYLLLPSCAARCWKSNSTQRFATSSLALLTTVVSTTALVQWLILDLPRTSLPLGHHNLLAGWLILILPVSLSAGLFSGASRWLAAAAGTTGLVALAATGSLLGAAAISLQIFLAAIWWKRLRPWLIPGLIILSALAVPRLLSLSQSADLSAQARASYMEAGWRGFLVRPTLGWGPGAVPWTIGDYMRPSAEVHPPSQIVGDLHSLPLQIAYEIGLVGILLILAILIVFFSRRRREIRQAPESVAPRVALLGLMGGLLFTLGAAPMSVPALPVTAAVVAGLALPYRAPSSSRRRIPWLLAYCILVGVVLLPLNRGHFHYDLARRSPNLDEGLRHLTVARAADPDFPLYLARQAWLAGEIDGVDPEIAHQALNAAQGAPGLAPLWLAAGDLGRRAAQPWASAALARAHRLDPLSPLVAFHMMMTEEQPSRALQLGAAAVTSEPRLAQAQWWLQHPDLAASVSEQTAITFPTAPFSSPESPLSLALTLDRTPAVSFSLFAFRRSPWPGRLAPIAMVNH